MGGLTSAVHWWEESQLRVLVLTTLLIQFLLFFFPILRRHALPGWFRFIMWLAYHGGDAVAIYALATLFNRHKDESDGGVSGGGSGSNTLLEVAWAPILLIHLGGHDGVTAYSIEDNELWTRHLLTAASQVTVAVYAFCKSWPRGGDRRLLQAAILLFTIGVVKCFTKAMAFKRASISSLVSSDTTAEHGNMCNKLEDYVKDAVRIVAGQQPGTVKTTSPRRVKKWTAEGSRKLFVDLSSSYHHRIRIFERFWGLSEEKAYDSVQEGLASAFFLLYTKLKTTVLEDESSLLIRGYTIILPRMVLPWAAIGLFHHSHREAYNGIDVKVTYAILCCTALLETFSMFAAAGGATNCADDDRVMWEVWPQTVAQYSLAGYFFRNKKHSIKMRIVRFLGCKDFLDQQWRMQPCFSSAGIASLVLRYLKEGWEKKIQNSASYRSFNNHSSHWGLNKNRPFDECVLLWHLATDFCFFSSTSSPDHNCDFAKPLERGAMTSLVMALKALCHDMCCGVCTAFLPSDETNTSRDSFKCAQESPKCRAALSRQVSNYMVYLLFVNPEMLLPGSRRNLFKTVYDELKGILMDLEWNPVCWSRWTPCGVKLIKEEAIVMKRLDKVMQERSKKKKVVARDTQQNSERSSQGGSSIEEGSNKEENFIDQAWALAQRLLEMDEMDRWKEIEDVWVQILCFSASRCRGYLHAKALGKGGEFLSYVWLLLFHMGMETFSEKLRRELLPSSQGNFHSGTTPPPTFEVSTTGAGDPSAFTVSGVTRAARGTTASTSKIQEVAYDVV